MRTYTAGTLVGGGYYINRDEWDMLVIPEGGQRLPGAPGNRYVKLPALALFLAAPLLGAVFAIFLPFIGLALFAKFGLDKAVHAIRTAPARRAHVPQTVEGPKAPPMKFGNGENGGVNGTDREC